MLPNTRLPNGENGDPNTLDVKAMGSRMKANIQSIPKVNSRVISILQFHRIYFVLCIYTVLQNFRISYLSFSTDMSVQDDSSWSTYVKGSVRGPLYTLIWDYDRLIRLDKIFKWTWNNFLHESLILCNFCFLSTQFINFILFLILKGLLPRSNLRITRYY